MIKPEEIVSNLGIQGLCDASEHYFASLQDWVFLQAKPFSSLRDAPNMLTNLGILLSGLRLCQTMRVLDFGAGSCWLTRYLTQMGCDAVALDPSKTALKIGRETTAKFPLFGTTLFSPDFLEFDGRSIDLEDQSVDRVVCFDSFHHVPNPKEVLVEFYRILKDGGIVGFSEPGRFHSQTPQSQYEMKNYKMLENNIRPEILFSIARELGFTDFSCKINLDNDLTLSLDEFVEIAEVPFDERFSGWPRISDHVYNSIIAKNTFYFHKGEFHPDSRGTEGLSYEMQIGFDELSTKAGQVTTIPLTIRNTGEAKWLGANVADIGIVKVGLHLYTSTGELLKLGYEMQNLNRDVEPGEIITYDVEFQIDQRGDYRVDIDLVAIYVTWFEQVGCTPKRLPLRVS